MVELERAPLGRALGPEVGAFLGDVHREHYAMVDWTGMWLVEQMATSLVEQLDELQHLFAADRDVVALDRAEDPPPASGASAEDLALFLAPGATVGSLRPGLELSEVSDEPCAIR